MRRVALLAGLLTAAVCAGVVLNLNREPRLVYDGERWDPPRVVVASYLDYAERPDTVREMISYHPETGLPVVDYGLGRLVDNPISTAQWGLQGYSRWVTSGDRAGLDNAVKAGDWLTQAQRADGAWVFDFPFHVDDRIPDIPAGWVSGMAQGQGMSLLVRLYRHTADPRYLDAAVRAVGPLTRTHEQGGVVGDLGGWFELNPAGFHVLNAHLYTLVGLWDLAPLHPPALDLYDTGRATLERNLARFDQAEGLPPSYDLRHDQLGGPVWYNPPYNTHVEGMLMELTQHRPSDEITRRLERWFRYSA